MKSFYGILIGAYFIISFFLGVNACSLRKLHGFEMDYIYLKDNWKYVFPAYNWGIDFERFIDKE